MHNDICWIPMKLLGVAHPNGAEPYGPGTLFEYRMPPFLHLLGAASPASLPLNTLNPEP